MMTIEQKKTALYELVGNTYQAISHAVAITTTTSEQAQAIATFCERVDGLTTTVADDADSEHWNKFCDIAGTAVQIMQAMNARQVTIVTGWQGGLS